MDISFWSGKRAPGVSNNIEIQYESAIDVIEEAFLKYESRPAFSCMGHTLTYKEIDVLSGQFASYLQNHTSLKRGDTIAVQMPNVFQYPVVAYGALRAGMRITNTNPMYTEREMLHQFNDSEAKALVCMDVFAHGVQNIKDKTGLQHIIVTSVADLLPLVKRSLVNFLMKNVKKAVPDYSLPEAVSFRKAIQLGKEQPFNDEHLNGLDDTIILQYTGGTTGPAKGAELTNRNILANRTQSGVVMRQRTNSGELVRGTDPVCVVAPLPLYHIYAFASHLFTYFSEGDHNILIPNPRDIDGFVKTLRSHKIGVFVGLNTLFVSLMNHPKFKNIDFSGLFLTISGGTALMEDSARRWESITDCAITEGYGLTECSPSVTVNPSNGLEQLGTVGQPMPGTELKCIDAEGNEVPIGERGELCVRGPQVMKGYWKRPDATKEAFTEDGEWFRTGDVAIIAEDGYVRIVDRIKDMIIVSGFNVFPNEIETVVADHPDIENCAVIGVPDEKSGEAVKLFVISSNPNLNENDLKTYLKERLTGYKMPRHIEFRDELPMTPVGKILRRELKDEENAKCEQNAA